MRARTELALIALAACAKKGETAPPPDAEPAPPVSVAQVRELPRSPVEAREATRRRVVDTDPFPPKLRGGEVQVAELGYGGRRALLATDQAEAMLVVLENDGKTAWQKDRPTAGMMPPAKPLAISGGPRGRVAMAACDPPAKSVALRLWDADGSPFADYQVLELETCDALSLLHLPRRGFVVVAVTAGTTRARYVTDEGAFGWSADVGVRSRPDALAPASLAADTDETFVLVQAATPNAEKGGAVHALAFRYDLRGQPVWPNAVDLGVVPSAGRLVVEPTKPAGVRVVSKGLDVDVKPSGAFSPRAPTPK